MAVKASTNKGRYTIKSYESYIYRWSPQEPTYDGKSTGGPKRKNYCTAVPGTQGEDWTNTYVYDVIISQSGQQQRIAYVECDYVK